MSGWLEALRPDRGRDEEVIGSPEGFRDDILHQGFQKREPFFMKVFFVYILYSKTIDKFYVGQTDNLDERLISHNSEKSPYTSRASDWKLVYVEEFSTRTLCRKRENEIKRKKSRKYIEWLVGSALSRQESG